VAVECVDVHSCDLFGQSINLWIRFINCLTNTILMMSLSQASQKKICPRCGQPYRWIYQETIHGRTYLYAVHEYVDKNGKKKRKKCYLGPTDSYEYISKTHGLAFYGLDRKDRYVRYLEEIINLFDFYEPVSTDLEEFKRDFENMIKIRSLVKRINNEVENRLRKIIETMISDVKTSIDVLRRDHPDDPKVIKLIKEIKNFDEEIERINLLKNFVILRNEIIRSYVEKYLKLKQKLKQFNL